MPTHVVHQARLTSAETAVPARDESFEISSMPLSIHKAHQKTEVLDAVL
jgi:hypothetical protein